MSEAKSNTDNNIQAKKVKLESKDYLRLILQGLAVIGGLWGLFAIYCGIHFIVSSCIDNSMDVIVLVNALMFFAMGGYLVMTAYLMVRKFSIRALRHFSAVVAFVLFGLIFGYIYPIAEKVREDKEGLLHIVINLLPLLCLVLAYKICVKLLSRLTKPKDEQKQ